MIKILIFYLIYNFHIKCDLLRLRNFENYATRFCGGQAKHFANQRICLHGKLQAFGCYAVFKQSAWANNRKS